MHTQSTVHPLSSKSKRHGSKPPIDKGYRMKDSYHPYCILTHTHLHIHTHTLVQSLEDEELPEGSRGEEAGREAGGTRDFGLVLCALFVGGGGQVYVFVVGGGGGKAVNAAVR